MVLEKLRALHTGSQAVNRERLGLLWVLSFVCLFVFVLRVFLVLGFWFFETEFLSIRALAALELTL